ncbi:hypothetical protein SAMN05421739_11161 [Pontibacter chinhatensis]|uniref:Uncharacterized protein n=1 Tax=Pontibacter chinhatensis TaxID=1436961 RepID=A0A1I2Z572_9BACT|nr:hypothetical protein SAMN05421739_11161 [Pontibacter chinhatensis]
MAEVQGSLQSYLMKLEIKTLFLLLFKALQFLFGTTLCIYSKMEGII